MRKTLIVIRSEREGSIAVVMNSASANVFIKSFQHKKIPRSFLQEIFSSVNICRRIVPYSAQ